MRRVRQRTIPLIASVFGRNKCFCLSKSALLSKFSTMRLLALPKSKNRAKRKTFWHSSRGRKTTKERMLDLPKKPSSNALNYGINAGKIECKPRWSIQISYKPITLIALKCLITSRILVFQQLSIHSFIWNFIIDFTLLVQCRPSIGLVVHLTD